MCAAVRSLLAQSGVRPGDIAGVGVDGQSWAAVAVDAKGEALANTPPSGRTVRGAARNVRKSSGPFPRRSCSPLCGNPLQPSYTMPKNPVVPQPPGRCVRRAAHILQSNSLIVLPSHRRGDAGPFAGLRAELLPHAKRRMGFNIWRGGLGIPRGAAAGIASLPRGRGPRDPRSGRAYGACAGHARRRGRAERRLRHAGRRRHRAGQTQEQAGRPAA